MYQDTYFLSPQQALQVAKEHNERSPFTLQICYYDGEKLDEELPNLVHIPIDKLADTLQQSHLRAPTNIDFTGLELTDDVKRYLEYSFKELIDNLKKAKKKQYEFYVDKHKKATFDFGEKWRVFMSVHTKTKVMQHISRNMAREFEKQGCEVYIEESHGYEDPLFIRDFVEFNPHIIFNINHLNNAFLNSEMFNFVWFQDVMPKLLDDSTSLHARKRDFVYHLTAGIKKLLDRKNIASSYQSFCIDTNVYKRRKKIQREKKIVFIGSSYRKHFDSFTYSTQNEIYNIVAKKFLSNGIISLQEREDICKQFNLFFTDLGLIMNYVERDIALLEIATLDLKGYKLEIYGNGWDYYSELKEFYKGVLNYGEDVSKAYNEATYCLVLGGYVMQQRTLESAASGCIPIVMDSRHNSSSQSHESFEQSLVFIQTLQELPDALTKKHPVDLEKITHHHTYGEFVCDILSKVKSTIEQ